MAANTPGIILKQANVCGEFLKKCVIIFNKYESCLRFQWRHFQRDLYRKVLYVKRNDY
jgi:hypothetical protein